LELRNPNRARGSDRAIEKAKRDCALTDLIHNPLSDAKFESFFDNCLFIRWYITYDSHLRHKVHTWHRRVGGLFGKVLLLRHKVCAGGMQPA
jgi:hypothetical protein